MQRPSAQTCRVGSVVATEFGVGVGDFLSEIVGQWPDENRLADAAAAVGESREVTGVELYKCLANLSVRTVGFRESNGSDLISPPVPALPATLTPKAGNQPEVNPNVRSVSTPLGLEAGALGFGSLQVPPRKPAEPRDGEPSIVGVWKGDLLIAGTRWRITSTLRANGTYKTIYDSGNRITAQTGTYTYGDGILTTEPEGGLMATLEVTFLDDDTIKVRGGGVSITYKRQ